VTSGRLVDVLLDEEDEEVEGAEDDELLDEGVEVELVDGTELDELLDDEDELLDEDEDDELLDGAVVVETVLDVLGSLVDVVVVVVVVVVGQHTPVLFRSELTTSPR
jgi:hypothetical protein